MSDPRNTDRQARVEDLLQSIECCVDDLIFTGTALYHPENQYRLAVIQKRIGDLVRDQEAA